MSTNHQNSILFLVVTGAASAISIVGLWLLLWPALPASWHQYLDAADGTLPLLILFLGVPVVLGLFGAIGFVFGALALTPFVSREDAEHAFRSLPTGGYIGTLENMLLSRFKARSNANT